MNNSIDEKIIKALEKLSLVIRTLLWDKTKQIGLSPIQIQFILFLVFHPDYETKVSTLAAEFNLTPATVSDAIRILTKKKLLMKIIPAHDKRIHYLKLTKKGTNLAREISSWQDSFLNQLHLFPDQQKEEAALFLMELITSLQKNGIIKIARMCISCEHFQKKARSTHQTTHYCKLTERYFSDSEITIDCSYYKNTAS
ncbi:MAG: hypothetical protein A2Y62_14710 [Candidatus Fischerbacteria bacterium RBG_13_37_8]|uniref:HTH marR-type domain-containing protein n=1 Tax=Candidatus Fischerbacteria bacterium RBG_13_37_8 TaxID=1817863 RepID=A0A1F5VMR2_9BACT|nr:MAG: hypothetical protein A2Y62_14710 [Candidatus Fischerbacteria bacterium RBG_13_37_8]